MSISGIGFPIIGIGSSAGGLEALESFFRNFPENSGMAFVVIQHLDPDQPGLLPELLQRITPMKVQQAANRTKVEPEHVYVIPPKKSLTLVKGLLLLSEPSQPRGLRLPVDIFLRSLADCCAEKAIAVILSGMGSDGSLGLKAIKEMNGLVLVQDPADAKFDSMPRSAMQSVNVDISATASELPARLIEFLKISPSSDRIPKPESHSELGKIIFLLRQRTGHDFSLYKKSTLYRRIERRREVHQKKRLEDYVTFLSGNSSELDILFKELLIGVTNFFRDPDVWEKLRNDIIPGLVDRSPDGYSIRAWVAGCSTGEEAYSLAIAFKDAISNNEKLKNISLQIFATDIDHDAIEKARKGVFSSNILLDISPENAEKYFTSDGDGYRVNDSIRQMIVFAEQSVIRDPPFTKLDILSCRNLLIYMEPELQKKLYTLFHYTLKPGGILMLGSSESLGSFNEWFEVVDSRLKLFRRPAGLISAIPVDTPSSFYRKKSEKTEKATSLKKTSDIQKIADNFVLNSYAPSTVFVNEKGDILYVTGHTGKYLEPVAGKANMNIYAMAHEGIRQELPNAFRKAIAGSDPVFIRNVKIGTRRNIQHVDIAIEHIKNDGSLNGLIIVVFIDVPGPVEQTPAKTHVKISESQKKELENELRKAYEDLQSTREEMQTSQEELKSTNEELQSTNEELQSANEELTTSKEEMQSLNEELQTVNSELQSKINDLLQSNSDMANLLNSTEIATLFLDRGLNIRRFTDPVQKIFNVRTTDIGRPFTDLVNNLQYKEIKEDAVKVIKTLNPLVNEIKTTSELWFSVRIMPYRTYEDHIDGLVITFTDITTSKKLELKLKDANLKLLPGKNLKPDKRYEE